jgi:hypothetical protein
MHQLAPEHQPDQRPGRRAQRVSDPELPAALQPDPLVAAGRSIVAIEVGEGALPSGLRERSPIAVVLPDDGDDPAAPPVTVGARVVGLPYTPDSAIGTQSLSIEVDEADAALVASADDVRVVLVSPRHDPAEDEG